MKSLTPLLVTLFVFFSPVVLCEKVNSNDLVEREGLLYKKSSDKPFSGTVCCETRGKVIKGKLEGKWTIWFENGQLSAGAYYKKGELNGLYESYYQNGQLSLRGYYKNGKMVGEWEMYKEDGTLDGVPDFDLIREGKK